VDEEPEVLDTRYELRTRLGSGGMADVYVGWDRQLEREVAIKRLRRDIAAEPGGRERFRREALALAAVDSPHVVGVHDVGPDGSYLVLRRAVGPTLAELVAAEGPLAPPRAVRIVAQVLDGLADLHAHRIVHRDVKPANVVIERRDRAVLLDLGVALDRRRPKLTPAGTIAGTPGYMAPEQERRRGSIDERTDLYQVGLLLQHALTGDRAVVPIPPALVVVLHRALASSPLERFLSSEEMRRALVEASVDRAEGEVAAAPRDALPEDPPTLVGRPTRS
jgi:serine/threonine protein kinase